MASARKRSAAPALDETQVEAELEAVRQRLELDGGVKLSTIKPKALAGRLATALAAEGFERSATWIRRPLREQLDRALAHGAALDRKSLAAQVRGASALELQRALLDAEREGRLRRVLRGKAEVHVGSAAAVLSAPELGRLRATVGALEKGLARAARKKGLTLLVSDVQQALQEATQLLPRPAAVSPVDGKGETALRSVVAAVGAAQDGNTGLAFVPDIVRWLSPAMSPAVAREMLLLAASRELVELRPEGGLGRLTPEDLELCPPGPARTRLSWARLLEGGQG
jgi:hypothetical protein